jgi:hypothetical protein
MLSMVAGVFILQEQLQVETTDTRHTHAGMVKYIKSGISE